MTGYSRGFVGVCLLGMAFAATPSFAQTTAALTPVAALVADIRAYDTKCEKVVADQAALFKQCDTEKKALIARQHTLNVSDDDINTQLNGRAKSIVTLGHRWP